METRDHGGSETLTPPPPKPPPPPAGAKAPSTAKWVFGPFLSVVLALVVGFVAMIVGWLVFIGYDGDVDGVTGWLLFLLPLSLWIATVSVWLVSGRRLRRRTGQSVTKQVLIGGIGLPVLGFGLFALSIGLNEFREYREDRREEQVRTLSQTFAEAAYPGFSEFADGGAYHDPMVEDVCENSGMDRLTRQVNLLNNETAADVLLSFEEQFIEDGWDVYTSTPDLGEIEVIVLVGHRENELIQARVAYWDTPQLHYRTVVGRCVDSQDEEVIEAALIGQPR